MIQMTTLLLMNVVLFILLSTARAFPQQITWLYAKDLDKGANFLGSTVELIEVEGLIQVDKCRIFSTSSSSFIGVCNTRDPPNCGNNAEDVPTPVTYTLVVDSEEAVDETYNKLLGVNGTEVFVLTALMSQLFSVRILSTSMILTWRAVWAAIVSRYNTLLTMHGPAAVFD